ncbi:hypothetical protein A2U01_0056263, partial [Trifolium medium]|nr:hypothetical protein [Trifolium medium]
IGICGDEEENSPISENGDEEQILGQGAGKLPLHILCPVDIPRKELRSKESLVQVLAS